MLNWDISNARALATRVITARGSLFVMIRLELSNGCKMYLPWPALYGIVRSTAFLDVMEERLKVPQLLRRAPPKLLAAHQDRTNCLHLRR